MSISYRNEPDSTNVDNFPVGLYYYFIAKSKIYDGNYLGYAPTIETVTYNPFIDEQDLDLICANFDTDRFGKPSTGIPKCYRIWSSDKIEKLLGEIDLFPTRSEMGHDYEPKLMCYPFRYFIVTDYINPPLLIKPELVYGSENKIRVKVITAPLSQEGKYNIFVENYKLDKVGNLEGIVNNSALMLPVASSAYAQFLATNASSFNQGVINSLMENDVTLKQGQNSALLNYQQTQISNLMGGIGNLLSLNFDGVAGNIANGIFANKQYDLTTSQMQETAVLKEQQINATYNAKISDMINTPRTLKTCGNDTLFNLVNAEQKVDIIEFRPHYSYMQRIQRYFNRYGYAINDYDKINFKSRRYFNYIKTQICNIGTTRVPHKDIQAIKDILNSGITFWHIDNGAEVGNYEVENEEV